MPEPFKPHYLYHAEADPVLILSPEQKQKMGPGWSERYIHKEYPKAMAAQIHGKLVEKHAESAEHEADLAAKGFKPRVEHEETYDPSLFVGSTGAQAPAFQDEKAQLLAKIAELEAQIAKKGSKKAEAA